MRHTDSTFIMRFTSFILSCFLCLFTTPLGSSHVCITYTKGPVEFNDQTHVCCDSMVSKRLAHQECCGNKIMDSREYICCGDQPKPRFAVSPTDGKKKEQSCCGSSLIFEDELVCCNGIPVKLTEEQNLNRDNLQCCKNGVIANYLLHEECCGENILNTESNMRCCGEESYNTSSHWCKDVYGQKVKLLMDQNTCVNEVYTVTEKICCYGVLNHTVPERDPLDIRQPNKDASCCETKVINPSKEKCCLESETNYKTHSIPNRPTFKCCGDSYVDTSCQACSSGQPIPKRDGQKACGSFIINSYEEDCCADHLRFNKTNQKCCSGSLSSVIPKHQKCCNGAGYTDNELCCKNTKPCSKSKQDDDECCLNELTNEAQTFNKGRQKCYRGQVVEVAPNREVCGNQDYNPDTHFCCEGSGGAYSRLVNKTSGYNQCCESTPFDNHTQTCCYGKVFDIPAENAWCCYINYKAYTYHDPSSPCTRRCSGGSSYYDILDETCCDGTVYPKRRNFECCGPFYFKSKSMTRGRRIANIRWPFDCCGNKDIFSKKTSVCLNGEILPKKKGLTDTQGVCHRPLWRSVDGVVKHACTSQYALVGKVRKITILRKAIPDMAIVEMTLTRISVLSIRRNDGGRVGSRKLKIRVEVPMGPAIRCTGGLRKSMKMVAVFFSAPVQGRKKRKVTIKSGDNFRIVKYLVLRRLVKYGVKKDFCRNNFSPDFMSFKKQDQLS